MTFWYSKMADTWQILILLVYSVIQYTTRELLNKNVSYSLLLILAHKIINSRNHWHFDVALNIKFTHTNLHIPTFKIFSLYNIFSWSKITKKMYCCWWYRPFFYRYRYCKKRPILPMLMGSYMAKGSYHTSLMSNTVNCIIK